MDDHTTPVPPSPTEGSGQAPPNRVIPPPVISPLSRTAPPRRGTGWMILSILLLCLLGLSVFINLSQVANSIMGKPSGRHALVAGPRLSEVIIEDNRGADKIAVIEVDGLITSQVIDPGGFSMIDVIRAELRRAEEDSRVKAVLLKVDSPGGEVLASDEINRAVVEFQKNSDKPVIASMGSVAASGGYYVAAGSRWIVAHELTLTGSIGVIMQSYNYRGLMDKVGLRPEVYKSGKFKDMLSGARDPQQIPSEEREMLQGMIDQTYARFKEVVASGRKHAHDLNTKAGRSLHPDWSEYADGRVLTGSEAFKLGFVDELGNFDDAVDRAREIAELPEADVVRYQRYFYLSDLFRNFAQLNAKVVKVELGMEAPKLKTGMLYFLSPNVLR